MRYGIVLTAGNIHEIAAMAAEAEAAGWDGVFYWDGIAIPGADPIYDPWVTLAAIAMRTERVRFGAIITPPSRRRPWKLARETVTLDHLSGGRIVLPVGLGAVDDPRLRRSRRTNRSPYSRRAPRREPGDPDPCLERGALCLCREALPDGGDDVPTAIHAAATHSDLGRRHLAAPEERRLAPSAMTASCLPSAHLLTARRLLTMFELSPQRRASAKGRASPSTSSSRA